LIIIDQSSACTSAVRFGTKRFLNFFLILLISFEFQTVALGQPLCLNRQQNIDQNNSVTGPVLRERSGETLYFGFIDLIIALSYREDRLFSEDLRDKINGGIIASRRGVKSQETP
jgi:hypothetical protein